MAPLLKEVTDAFDSLLKERLLRIDSSDVDESSFGNAVVMLSGRNLRIRVVRDRGDTFADATSRHRSNDWFPLQSVVKAVGVVPGPSDGLLSPQRAANLVRKHIAELERGLEPEHLGQTISNLAQLERVANQRVRDRLAGDK